MRNVRKLFKPSDSLWFAKILGGRAYTRLKGGIKVV